MKIEDLDISILFIIGMVVVLVFIIPLVKPEITIQCISAPCIVPNITIAEWLFQHFA